MGFVVVVLAAVAKLGEILNSDFWFWLFCNKLCGITMI